MLYPLQMAAPDVEFIPANAEASCRFMKMITLPKLRDALLEMKFEVRVPRGHRRAGAGADRPHGRDRLGGHAPGRRCSELVGRVRPDAGDGELLGRRRRRPRATSSKVTASSAAIAASGSIVPP